MSSKDSELKPLLEKLLDLYEVQITRFDKLEGMVRENTAAINSQAAAINSQAAAINSHAEMINSNTIAINRHAEMINSNTAAINRQENMINNNAAALAALSKKVDDGFQKTAILIQSDRTEIAEVRGGLDVLGKRFDALVSLKRD